MGDFYGIPIPDEIGIPNIDILGMINGFFEFIKNVAPGIIEWLFAVCGGNPIVVGMVVGFPIYLVIDFTYHRILDKPAAALGERMMVLAGTIAIFVIVFFFTYSMWTG